ncbi:DUF4175 domain-containing protein [Limnoglobus roseus]|uniref:Phage tail tape measure protein n=1 Tax=Limnoglobus roseus TaxID=2598579 RepID=A0A5C1AF14_9BACT|nr:DUF4175 domain-containing protein [Limnoglobus roseus]QEL16556.1 phage tail tape measure protein [Limnoglobus roseus]
MSSGGANVGKGALELGVNSEGLNKGLDQAAAKAEATGSRLGRVANKISGGFSRAFGLVQTSLGGGRLFDEAKIAASERALDRVKAAQERLADATDKNRGRLTEALKKAMDDPSIIQAAKTRGGRIADAIALRLGKVSNVLKSTLGVAGGVALGLGLFEGAKKAVEQVDRLKDRIEKGENKNQNLDFQGLANGSKAIENISNAIDVVVTKFAGALAPSINLVAQYITDWLPRLTPVFNWVSNVLSEVISVVYELADSFLSGVASIVDSIASWINETTGLGDTWITASDLIIGAFRGVGVAGAYVWDTLKAGAGVAAIAFALIPKALAFVVGAFKELINLADYIPSAFKPTWLGDFQNGIEKTQSYIQKAGDDMTAWGVGAISSFGKSAAGVNEYFDNISDRALRDRIKASKDADLIQEKMKASEGKRDAIIKGSKEDFSFQAKIRTEALLLPKDNKTEKAVDKVGAKVAQVNETLKQGFANFGVI